VRTVATPREQLADLLKQARIEAGYGSQAALAKKLSVSRPVISKAESSVQPVPSDQILTAWAGVTGVALDKLTGLADRCRSGTPEWFMSFQHAEAQATILRYWSPIVVPGIAQTRGYMRTLFQEEGHLLDRVDELVSARLERQSVLGRVHITMIISQQVLYYLVGSPAIMAEQCGHLASVAERSGMSLHVLPEGVSKGVWGALDIATRDGTTTVCLWAVEDVTSTAPGLVEKAIVAFERILGAALPHTESLERIRTAEGQWKTRTT
jgi:transcriptional regulator with XRE-family HTH domain